MQREKRGEVKDEDKVEVVFLSPPWGGIDYQTLGQPTTSNPTTPSAATPRAKKLKTANVAPATPTPILPTAVGAPPPSYPLSALAPLPGDQLFSLARQLTPHVAYYLPRNVDVAEVAALPRLSPREGEDGTKEMVEIEEEWMGKWKCKAVTAYFGDLATNGSG